MKVQKLITIDIEVFKNLSEIDNASGLINTLLKEHFGDNRTDDEIIQDVKDKIKEKAENSKIKEKRDKATDKLKKAIEKEI